MSMKRIQITHTPDRMHSLDWRVTGFDSKGWAVFASFDTRVEAQTAMPGARETTAVAPLMLARWHHLEAHLRLQGPDSAHLLVVEVTGQASLVWTRVEYAGPSGGFGQPAQVVVQERGRGPALSLLTDILP